MYKRIYLFALTTAGITLNIVSAAPVAIDSLSIKDINGDGISGLFTIGNVTNQWTGDTGIDMLWGGATQGTGTFTTGILGENGQPFVEPLTDLPGLSSTNNGAIGPLTI